MLAELNKALGRRYLKAYETGDIDAVMEVIDPKYVLHPGGSGKSMDAEERRRSETVFFKGFSNIQVRVEDQIAEGDKITNRITMQCAHTGKFRGIAATGKLVTIPCIDIILVKNGKIVEEWAEYDMRNVIQQLQPTKKSS